ncbi:halocyanin domain-containing protein [Halobaculum gomorrense]|uniref:Halocyanin domain-containing protein n=1 Tax=Halobaculum gomorrense TaxID=43928 RepID=A0A1M5RE56_9EURY|nr:halocyanin domain-containing protein [Halobaculum gomorrense]SHH24366.1 halocyanin domain-containing protein [Halobaculum gomorrense]
MSDPTTTGRVRGRPATTRRRLLAAVGATAAAGVAGCTGANGDGDGGGGGAGGDAGTERYDGWLADASGYDGSVADRTGADEATVRVGAGDGFAYDPAAVRVSPGTTVTWEWTGAGSRHNVVDEDGGFQSPYYAAQGATFSREFSEPGVTKYYCTPHRTLGMVGVVEVVEE